VISGRKCRLIPGGRPDGLPIDHLRIVHDRPTGTTAGVAVGSAGGIAAAVIAAGDGCD
jgi:hypothetical protein